MVLGYAVPGMDEAHVPQRIQELRESLGLGQLEFGAQIGKRPETISRWENGRTTPSLREMVIIASKFGKSLDWFAGDDQVASERLANATDHAVQEIRVMQKSLGQLLVDLAEARAFFAKSEAQIDAATGRVVIGGHGGGQGGDEPGESIAIAREATG